MIPGLHALVLFSWSPTFRPVINITWALIIKFSSFFFSFSLFIPSLISLFCFLSSYLSCLSGVIWSWTRRVVYKGVSDFDISRLSAVEVHLPYDQSLLNRQQPS
jgi:hypothetical protein